MKSLVQYIAARCGVTARRKDANELALEGHDFQSGLGDSFWVLYALVRSLKPDICVEIGSARGKSAGAIGLALMRNGKGKLHAIDPHCYTSWNDTNSANSLHVMLDNLERFGVSGHVEIMRTTSVAASAAWRKTIDILFIDGDHSYEGVKADWNLFLPHTTSSSVVIFHDTLWDLTSDPNLARKDMGVPRFVDELRVAGYPVVTINKDFGVSIVQPVKGGMALR
jgi:predicted O-methyltransferase YrrM